MKNICFSSKNICTHPLCLGHLGRVGRIHGGQGRRQLEYFPQHEVGAQVEVHARAQNLANNILCFMFVHRNLLLFASHLAEPVVLQLLVPGVQVEHLLPELDLLPRRVALLHTTQDVAET